VSHREFFSDVSALPVFNSHAIETQLHLISGLSNNFLYLNDDMLFGAPTIPADFVSPGGVSAVFISKNAVPGPSMATQHTPVDSAFANVRKLILSDFGVEPRSAAWHAPYSLRVDVLSEMAERYRQSWDRTMRSRFRSREDVSPTSAFYQHYSLLTGRGVPGTITYNYTNLAIPDLDARLGRLSSLRTHQAICLNDSDSRSSELVRVNGLVQHFLSSYFPLPAPWETP
jgi:hypothetical protein